MIKTKEAYEDITNEWLNCSKSDICRIEYSNIFIDDDGNEYYIDNKNVVFKHNKEEIVTAKWLARMLGGTVYLLPSINYPKGIKTADYLFNNEFYDLKNIRGSGKRVVDYIIKPCKGQSNNFIIDISHCPLDIDNIIDQVKRIYITKGREWINVIVIKKGNKLINIFKRK